jgi:Fe-S oxidoreductase
MFDEKLCDLCGDCLVRCQYVDYDEKRAAFEIGELIAGRSAPILSSCITCFACNEYCPTQARPFDLILERQEQFGSLGIAADSIAADEARYTATSQLRVPENAGTVFSVCVFASTDGDLVQGRLFETLPTVRGRHFFCFILFDHLGAGSVTRRHAQGFVDHLAATGAEEVILLHDDCYGMLVDRCPQFGIEVPFRPVHLVEYLQRYLEEHRNEINPLGLRVAYQRPCSSRMSPGKEQSVDAVLDLIGVDRVERRYDREDCLCCGMLVGMFNAELGTEIRRRNVDDAVEAGAQAMGYLCPMCRRGLGDEAKGRGLENYHIIELVRMALGEMPRPV